MEVPKRSPCKELKPLIINTTYWGLLSAYLAGEKERLVTRLINCRPEDLRQIQGELTAIQKMLDLPLQLKTAEQHPR